MKDKIMRGRCYYTLSELSKITGVSVSTLKREIRENKLKISKLKRKYKVTLTELKNYLSPEKYEEFFNHHYLSEEKLFNVAGVEQSYWKNTLLLQSPDWDYVLIFTKRPNTIGEMVKVGLNPVCELERETIISDQFISLLQSNQFTNISKYEESKLSEHKEN